MAPPIKYAVDRDTLYYWYNNLGMTQVAIANKIGCSEETARRLMLRHGLMQLSKHYPGWRIRERELTADEARALFAFTLGDGGVYIREDWPTNAHFACTHSLKQEAYLLWKYSLISNLCLSPPKSHVRVGKYYLDGSCIQECELHTVQHPGITPLRVLFYPDGKKHLTSDVLCRLDAFSLAILYMDDGTIYRGHGVEGYGAIATYGFEYEEVVELAACINDMLCIKDTKRRFKVWRVSGGKYPLLHIPRHSEFFDMIRPYVIPSMAYKLP